MRVPYSSDGDPGAQTVVLLHAWGESMTSFVRLRESLPPHIRVVTFDQRGHGDADKPQTGFSLRDLAEDTVALLDRVGAPSAVLVGSSSGGYVAQQVVVDHPERVAGLVLVGSPRSLRGRPPFADDVERLTDPVDPDWVRDSLGWFRFAADVPAWFLEERVRDGIRMPARAWIGVMHGLMSADPPTEKGTIRTPTLILCGGQDDVVPLTEQAALAEAIPGSRLRIHDDAAHLLLWEQPEWVADAVADFLSELA